MKILYDPRLTERPFGIRAVRVESLLSWLKSQGAVLPDTYPDVCTFEAVQIEALLAAIERGAQKLADEPVVEAAVAMIERGASVDQRVRKMIIDERDSSLARWFYGAACAAGWRRILGAALDSGALSALDAETGIPVTSASSGHPMPKQAHVKAAVAQREAILQQIKDGALDPKQLPPLKKGRRDEVKQAALNALVPKQMTKSAFAKAWQSLLSDREIKRRTD
ncbi:MAG: hypothetical protein KF891_03985 [Rhizobacter sp.]|nr:hypothetical protein [Rhizobacter sp.]